MIKERRVKRETQQAKEQQKERGAAEKGTSKRRKWKRKAELGADLEDGLGLSSRKVEETLAQIIVCAVEM